MGQLLRDDPHQRTVSLRRPGVRTLGGRRATRNLGHKRTRAASRACCPLYALAAGGYWLSGLNVRMPASVVEQTPAGSTRTTASSSAQKPRRPVWLIVIGTAFTV